MDPLAERYYQWSPYNYVQNNPLLRVDPFGLTDYEINRRGKITKVEGSDTDDGKDRLIKGTAKYDKKTGDLKGKEGKTYISMEKGILDKVNNDDNG